MEDLKVKKSKLGRKTIEDKKIPISIYLKQSEIFRLGGGDELRTKLLKYATELLKTHNVFR
jgi:hypothetical protein